MFFLRTGQRGPGANAVVAALALLIVANPKLDVMADTSYTGPPLSYNVYGPGDGCVDDALAFTGSVTSAAVLGDATVCETDELVTPDGTFEVYSKFVGSCGNNFQLTLYNCMDSMCTDCDADAESVGHMEVANLRDAYNTVDVCWRFYEDDGTTIAFGNQSGLSAQRFDATNDLSNLQEYIEIIVGGACGEAWLADNIVQGPAGGDPTRGGPGADGCIPGTVRCPELDTCIRSWQETCPIEGGVAFSGGATLSCDSGRCATDTLCEWSDGSATYGTYYWTNLDGTATLPEGCTGITCTGCVASDAAPTAETEMNAEMDADLSGSMDKEMDADMDAAAAETSGTVTAASTWAVGQFMPVLLAVTGTSMLFV